MFNIKKSNKKGANFFGLMVIINIILVSFSIPTLADETAQQDNNSDYGLPTHRRDGGSRGGNDSCVNNPTGNNLVALIPDKTIGINASASPKLFFYVPQIQQQKTLEFILRNEQDELIYEAFLTTKGEGIMSVDIPDNVQANLIEKDTNYHWYLSIICNSQQRSRDIVVEGWMRQTALDPISKQELNSANPVAQAELYQEQGYWFDALSVLASEPISEEEPIVKAKWSELLESVGLEELATEPFVKSELIKHSIK